MDAEQTQQMLIQLAEIETFAALNRSKDFAKKINTVL